MRGCCVPWVSWRLAVPVPGAWLCYNYNPYICVVVSEVCYADDVTLRLAPMRAEDAAAQAQRGAEIAIPVFAVHGRKANLRRARRKR